MYAYGDVVIALERLVEQERREYLAYVVMANIVITYIVMACIVMAM